MVVGRSPPAHQQHQHLSFLFAFLLAFRILNALTLRTFFQPDEYFQSLEPAWQLAFGADSGAWLTWEWHSHLRSSLHPLLFALAYTAASAISRLCSLSAVSRAQLLLAAPKLTQACLASCLDLFTYGLAQRLYGRQSRVPLVALALTVFSPWQWFCSTRTLSNCLETTLTAGALFFWPWHWSATTGSSRSSSFGPAAEKTDQSGLRIDHRSGAFAASSWAESARLRLSYLFAAVACFLRPTNVLIWTPIALLTLRHATGPERRRLLGDALLCGALVSLASVLSDRMFYQTWTFPPWRFLQFNISQDLAVFYGRNRPDYYLTEGLPLLLTTYLPFAVVAVLQGLSRPVKGRSSPETAEQSNACSILSVTVLFTTAAFSLISHKEVRFVYPLLPALHALAAGPAYRFFGRLSVPKRFFLNIILLVNVLIALYASQVHQRGVISVVAHLRETHEARLAHNASAITGAGFLMPCHSTPWRSHLVHPGIQAWALTCEPPLDIPIELRGSYLDEADRFYMNPQAYIQAHLIEPDAVGNAQGFYRVWPQHLVFFEQLEPTLRKFAGDKGYMECWRGFNSHWHDDWRRKGDVIVWCR